MRLGPALVLAFAVAGCKGAHDEPAPAPAGSAAPASSAKAAPSALFRIGAPGSSVHAHDLAARADGGFVIDAELFGALPVGTTQIAATIRDPVDAVIALDPTGKVRWVHAFGGHCAGLHIATHDTTTLVAGTCSDPIAGPNGPITPPTVDGHLHVFIALLDDTGAITWATYAGEPGTQVVNAATFDPDGNAVVAGRFSAPIDLGTGKLSPPASAARSGAGFVASYDAKGHARWVATFPNADVQAVSATSDEIAIAGSFSNRTLIGRISLAPTADEGIAGRFVARLSPMGGATAAVVVGSDASNGQELVRGPSGALYLMADDLNGVGLYSIDGANHPTELKRIASRDICLVGHRTLAVDPSGALWLATCFGRAIDLGGRQVASKGSDDAIVVKYDANGTFVGQQPLATEALDTSAGVAIGADGRPVTLWFTQSGPAGKPYREWLTEEVYYAAALERVAL